MGRSAHDGTPPHEQISFLERRVEELEGELEKADENKVDAERYRHLRNMGCSVIINLDGSIASKWKYYRNKPLDTAVDASIKLQREEA